MGVLDEAIREHLELKRKHGASPEEVKRQQDEALGPARREPPPEEQEQAAEAQAAEPAAEPAEPEVADAPVAEDVGEPTRVLERPAMAEPSPEPEHPHGDALLDGEEPGGRAAGEGPPPDELQDPDPPHGDALLHPDSAEPDRVAETHAHVDPGAPAEPAASAAGEQAATDRPEGPEDAEAEDVLEETPDFLQETPEHDRLWFEQKPPRDFDFD